MWNAHVDFSRPSLVPRPINQIALPSLQSEYDRLSPTSSTTVASSGPSFLRVFLTHLALTYLFFFGLTLQLLLEYDDQHWDQREWISIHQPGLFHVFLVEHNLWWAPFDNTKTGQSSSTDKSALHLWPALVNISSS